MFLIGHKPKVTEQNVAIVHKEVEYTPIKEKVKRMNDKIEAEGTSRATIRTKHKVIQSLKLITPLILSWETLENMATDLVHDTQCNSGPTVIGQAIFFFVF